MIAPQVINYHQKNNCQSKILLNQFVKLLSEFNQKIAIIGSGISGMAAAWLLRKKYQITLFEQNDYIGGHSNTVDINYNGKNIAVDTGFIVYNNQTYPHLTQLFSELQVEITKSNMSFGVSVDNGKIEYSGNNLAGLFAQKKNIADWKFWKMLKDIVIFNKKAAQILDNPEFDNLTLREFLDHLKMGEYFRKYYILPMSGAIWSCSLKQIENYPVKSFVRFFKNHGLLTIFNQPQWYSVKNGSREYVKLLTKDFQDQIQIKNKIVKIKKQPQGLVVIDDQNNQQSFDKIVIAAHANQALEMLDLSENDLRHKILSNFKYQKNLAILHKDQNLMPKKRAAWASWVYLSEKNSENNLISLTYWMNLLQNIDHNYPLFVTLNPGREIRSQDIFKSFEYHHPLFDQNAVKAQKNLPEIQGIDDIYFCGAYHNYGFHEDGLKSAIDVANLLNVKAPWQ